MKQTVIDILIYLFEHYIDDEIELDDDQDRVKSELRDAGFDGIQIGKAFDWLQGLATTNEQPVAQISENVTSVRIYLAEEQSKLDAESRGFIHFLEGVGVLDATNREVVIDRVMALEADEIDIDQLKWIVLMVLFNRPGQEQAFVWMEDLVMDEMYGCVH
jgi:Smg protein